MKIGKQEKIIIDYLQSNQGSAYSSDISNKFAPFYRKAGNRTGSTLHSVIRKRLNRMVEKGLIVVGKDSKVQLCTNTTKE